MQAQHCPHLRSTNPTNDNVRLNSPHRLEIGNGESSSSWLRLERAPRMPANEGSQPTRRCMARKTKWKKAIIVILKTIPTVIHCPRICWRRGASGYCLHQRHARGRILNVMLSGPCPRLHAPWLSILRPNSIMNSFLPLVLDLSFCLLPSHLVTRLPRG